MACYAPVCLGLLLLPFYGCGGNLNDRMVVYGDISFCSPAEWTVDEERNGVTIISGEEGRLSVAVLNMPSGARDSEDLMDTLRVMSPELKVIAQNDFSAGDNMGKEFVVSCLGKGRKQDGVVYLIGRDRKLCVLTFVAEKDGLEEWLDVFRESAGTLRFMGPPLQ